MEGLKAIIVGILIAAVVGFAIGFLVRGVFTPTATINSNKAAGTQAPLTGGKQTPTPKSGATTIPASVSSENIKVYAPLPDDLVSDLFTLKGEARVFENVLNFRLTDVSGNILSEGNITTDAPDVGKFGKFEVKIEFSRVSDVGTLEVFSLSPKDGGEINKVEIPLKFE